MRSNFNETWQEQVEHADYEYSTWNWWYWLKIYSGKFSPKIEICSNFHNSQEIFIFLLIT